MAYLKCQDEVYEAANESDTVPFSWTKVILKLVVQTILNIPYHVVDFIKAYIWSPKKNIKGHVVLVSGGANGLGRALCLRFAREGCAVAVVDVDQNGATRTVNEIRQLGVKAEAFQVDVSDVRSVRKLRKDVERSLGPVQILVNNAALLSFASINQGSDDEVQKLINVNLSSHFWMIRQFLPGMQQRKEGHIVAISSVLGIVPNFRTIAYSATKFGIRGMMASLSDELYFSGFGDKVFTTCVYPDLIATRKELIQTVNKMGLSTQVLSPEHAANLVVDGVLRNKTDIILASFPIRKFIKLSEFCSSRMRRIYTSCICTHPNE
ncbi:AAEL014840-PA [Aedes aegypti]|uniref:Short-chain dehydrogenase/reductase 3 n=2 Tax=Aedes aegypti TaxID=7159 RepID=A0A1S4G2P7_AEDAE|nr:17-beta-hydroxysteroid dehydrogenase 13 [Aedes aegypti]EAT32922.1 AAEL014840-PA [Aedes aegypti]